MSFVDNSPSLLPDLGPTLRGLTEVDATIDLSSANARMHEWMFNRFMPRLSIPVTHTEALDAWAHSLWPASPDGFGF
jgi:hypothetical protein